VTPLERRYRLWLLAYPGEYRREHDEELVGTLLEAAAPGQEWPSAREAGALLTGGLRTRARLAAASPVRMWTDGLRLGLIVYLAVACVATAGLSLHYIVLGSSRGSLGYPDLVHLEAAVLAIGVVALVWAAYEVGLAAMAGMVVIQGVMMWNDLPLLGGPVALIPAGLVLVAAFVAALAWHPSLRPARRPWPARLTVAALAGIALGTLCFLALDGVLLGAAPAFSLALIVAQPELLVPAAILLLLALLGLDPRPALAATVFAAAYAAGQVQTLAITHGPGFPAALYAQETLVSLATAALALAVTVLSARRRVPI